MLEHSEAAVEKLGSSGPAQPGGVILMPLWRHMLGDELRRLRHERGETLGDTAKNAGVSPQYLSEMERGVKDPSSEMIAAVAGALRVTLLDLTRAVSENLEAVPSEQQQALTIQNAASYAASYVGLALAA